MLQEGGRNGPDNGEGCCNSHPFCQCFPWLPRGWWVAAPAEGLQWIAGMSREDELGMLKQHQAVLSAQIEQIRSLISSLEGKENIRQGGNIK